MSPPPASTFSGDFEYDDDETVAADTAAFKHHEIESSEDNSYFMCIVARIWEFEYHISRPVTKDR